MNTALTPDLRVLTYSALLCLLLWVPYVLAVIKTRGLAATAGYPTGVSDGLPEWAKRSARAHANLVENLAPFAALVIVAHLAGAANAATAMAAWVFFGARLVQATVHIAGIPWLRTAAFFVGWGANLAIFRQIIY